MAAKDQSNAGRGRRGEVWAAGDLYEPYVGRWSRSVASGFLDPLGVPEGARWLDVGCGTGALTRAILKNKGLTPKRAKSVRNPRVKKRLKYEQAKKRVASQRAVFKGGLAGSKGVYEGERSGINPRVVKSTRLG